MIKATCWWPIPSTGGIYEASDSGEIRRIRPVVSHAMTKRGEAMIGLISKGLKERKP